MDLPYFFAVEVDDRTARYPLAIIQTDDFDANVSILISGPDAMAWAEEIARRCNQTTE